MLLYNTTKFSFWQVLFLKIFKFLEKFSQNGHKSDDKTILSNIYTQCINKENKIVEYAVKV